MPTFKYVIREVTEVTWVFDAPTLEDAVAMSLSDECPEPDTTEFLENLDERWTDNDGNELEAMNWNWTSQ